MEGFFVIVDDIVAHKFPKTKLGKRGRSIYHRLVSNSMCRNNEKLHEDCRLYKKLY